MKKSAKPDPLAERPDLDFSKGARGKYSNLLARGTNIAIIDPALLPHFPDSASVNRALRAFLEMGHSFQAASSTRRRPKSSTRATFDPLTGTGDKRAIAR